MTTQNALLVGIFILLIGVLNSLAKIKDSLDNIADSCALIEDLGDGLYSAGNIRPPRDPNDVLGEEVRDVVKFPFRNEI